jgi:hypothetical protein
MRRWAGLEPRVGDWVELRIVDASLAHAFFVGIPAARLLARIRLALDADLQAPSWDSRLSTLFGTSSFPEAERVRRAVARHLRVAENEGPIASSDATIAVLAVAVASDVSEPGHDPSLAEIVPPGQRESQPSAALLRACSAYDERLASAGPEARLPAFEACLHLATRAVLGPLPWERLRAIAAQLERAEIGVSLFTDARGSIFPPSVDEEVPRGERRMSPIDRAPLDALVAIDPRQLAHSVWRTEQASGGPSVHLATFLADLTRLLAHEGSLVAAVRPREAVEFEAADSSWGGAGGSWAPTEWNASTAAAMADALERGATTFARLRAAARRGGDLALDALGAEILRAGSHAFANAAFAEILAKSGRPRDVLRLVTYFAIAPDPGLAAPALGACAASELPRVLGAWLEAMLPEGGTAGPDSAAARVSACIASLKPYPHLYHAVERLLPRVSPTLELALQGSEPS